jgi:uncharacterized protein (DUF1499 family)
MRLKPTPSIARWTTRVALFALSLLVVAAVAHRFGPMPTLTAFNLFIVAVVASAVALLLGLAAGVVIWRQGTTGAIRVSLGMLIAVAIIAWPAAFVRTVRALPPINDVTTDTTAPPRFTELAKQRGPGSNPTVYPAAFAALQADAYPDLKPMLIERPADETFEIAREAIARQRLTIVREQPPGDGTGDAGIIEAVDRTPILGFYDDIAVRVDGDDTRSRIDLRSASRFGRHDLGRNAERTRRLMREIVARLEATVPTSAGDRLQRVRNRLMSQKARDAVRGSRRPGSAQDPSRAATPRELELKAQPRAR